MGIMKYIGAILLFFWVFLANSQEQGKEIIDGKEYYIHVVERGNTLYGLHQYYKVEIDAIIEANPSSSEGLQIGQRLKIPTGITNVEESVTETKDTLFHLVEPRETLFGISRKYDCSIEEITAANPGAEDGIKINQKLIIPCKINTGDDESDSGDSFSDETPQEQPIYELEFEDSIVKYTVQRRETLYSISKRFMVPVEKLVEVNDIKNNKIKPGQELIIPLKKERIERIPTKPVQPEDTTKIDSTLQLGIEHKEKYNITLLLPLKVDANAQILSGLYDDKTRINDITNISVDFLLGAEQALDSLEKLGLVANVYVKDTEGSLTVLKSILEEPEVKESDLLIGPFFPKSIAHAADWAKSKGKQIVIPVGASADVLKDNPFVSVMVPSDLTLIGGMAKYLAQTHYDDNVMLVGGQSNDHKNRDEYFTAIYESYLPEESYRSSLKKVDLGSSSGRDLARTYDLDTHNIYISLAEDAQHVMQFINTLNASKNYGSSQGKAKVTAFGMRDWHKISALSSYYKNRFELHTPMPNYLSYNTSLIKEKVEALHETHKIDPSRYFFQGFDVVFASIATKILGLETTNGYINRVDYQRVGATHGFENSTVFIVKQKDFDLHLMGCVNHSPLIQNHETTNEGKLDEGTD